MEPEIEDLSYPLVLDGVEYRVDTRYAHDLKDRSHVYALFTGTNANRYLAFMKQYPNVIADVYREESVGTGCRRYYVVQTEACPLSLDVTPNPSPYYGHDRVQKQIIYYHYLRDVTDAVVRLKKLHALLG